MSLKIFDDLYWLENNRLRFSTLLVELMFSNLTSHSFKMYFGQKNSVHVTKFGTQHKFLWKKFLSCNQSVFPKLSLYLPHDENMVVPMFDGLSWYLSRKYMYNVFFNRVVSHFKKKSVVQVCWAGNTWCMWCWWASTRPPFEWIGTEQYRACRPGMRAVAPFTNMV